MSNASLKDQLKMAASQLSINLEKKPQQAPSSKRKPDVAKKPVIKRPRSTKPKPAWLEDAHRGVALLKKQYPDCFFSGDKIQPLKIGIKVDLVNQLAKQADISSDDKDCMLKSLSYYVNTLTYLQKVTEGAARIDLNGQQAGTISAEEAKYSLERLQVKQNKQKKQKPTHPAIG